jgi:galactitol-specific phosphotransferase system IIB component
MAWVPVMLPLSLYMSDKFSKEITQRHITHYVRKIDANTFSVDTETYDDIVRCKTLKEKKSIKSIETWYGDKEGIKLIRSESR